MFLSINSSCSYLYKGKDYKKELRNTYNRELISNFSKAISKNPDNFLFYFERGIAKHNYGDYSGAIEDFNNSFSLNSDSEVTLHKANSKYAYGDYKGAINDYKKFLSKKHVFQDQVFYGIASSHLILLNYREAIKNYTESIEYDQDENAFLNRGNAKFKISDFLGSLKDYEKSIKINKKSYITFNNIGVSKFKLGEYRSALKDFQKSLKINPHNYNTFYNKSLTHFELNEIKKACNDLKKSIKLGKEIFKEEYSRICFKNLK